MNKYQIFDLMDNLTTPNEELARSDLFFYSMLFNKEIEPTFDYSDKFFTILSNKFQEFYNSQADLFLLEASPRTGKTDFVVNIFMIWILGNHTRERFIIVCDNKKLMTDLRRKLERVFYSPLFERMFPTVKVKRANESEIILSNENLIAFTTSGSTTPIGTGYHWHFYIDYLNAETLRSPAKTEKAFSQLTQFLTRTQNNPNTRIIVDNQRLGPEDLSNYFVTQYKEYDKPMFRLTFPYQFDEDRSYDVNGKEIKFKKGEFLVSRFNEDGKKTILARQGLYNYETQYLQKPRKARGDLVRRDMLKFYTNYELQNVDFRKGIITTDLALEDKEYHDYNVFCFWLIDHDDNLYLADMLRLKVKGIVAESALYKFYLKCKEGKMLGLENNVGCTEIHFEDTTNTKPTIQRYQDGLVVEVSKWDEERKTHVKSYDKIQLRGIVKTFTRVKKKFSRFIDALPHIEAGKVFLPSYDIKIDGIEDVQMDIVEPLIKEAEEFREDDSHDHDDIVDNLVDGITAARTTRLNLKVGF